MEYMVITDTIIGKTPEVTSLRPDGVYTVTKDLDTPELVKPRSVGKAIRTWMKEKMKERKMVNN